MCVEADDHKDIRLAIARSVRDLEGRHDFSGWVSARGLTDTSQVLADVAASAKSAADLREANRQLEQQIEAMRSQAVRLASGGDLFELFGIYVTRISGSATAGWRTQRSWDDLLRFFGPSLIAHALDEGSVRGLIVRRLYDELKSEINVSPAHRSDPLMIDAVCFQSLRLQFVALGLIVAQFSAPNGGVYWHLTPAGREHLFAIAAIQAAPTDS
jgi:hypothetical protein